MVKRYHVYFALAIVGTVLPLSQFVPWLLQHGPDVRLFIEELFSTRIGGFFGWDVIVSALVVATFIVAEGRALGMSRLWMPLAGTFMVGVSLGLPLFLALRELHQSRHQPA